jgi:gliding motility-associated-like protein
MKKIILFITLGVLFILSSKESLGQVNAEFTADTTTGCSSAIITFTDQSTGGPTSWEWDFGDGSALVFLQNPIHFYAAPGTYTVTLTASNSSGSDIEIKTSYITIFSGPTAQFTVIDSNGCLPFTVDFLDATILGGGAITSWAWDFGDGGTSIIQNPTYTYTSIGTYTVSLTVTDTNGCSNIITKTNHITVSTSPVSSFTQNTSISCTFPLNVNFTNNSTGTGLSYDWSFGNGDTSTLQTPPFQTYNSMGTFTNTLIVTNVNGCSDTSSQIVTIAPFVANFGQDTTSICPGDIINFSDSSSNGVNAWAWDFGDGGSSTAQNPTYTYLNSGIYTVSLIVTNAAGCTDSISITNLIIVNPNPVAAFSANDSTACQVPFLVNFTDLSTGATSWSWNFGDGNTANTQNPSNIYTALSNYNVSLSISDINGCTDSIFYNSLIQIIPPTVAFNKDTTSGCAPLTVNFTDASSPSGVITNWFWDFGDGGTSTAQNPNYIYTDTGTFNVTLVIVNAEGCTDTLTEINYIQVGQPPVINFTPTDTSLCYPLPIDFFDNSSIFTNQWAWDFGDGGTSNSQNPTHTYADTGYFDVTLAAAFNGCWDTLHLDSVVEILLPIAQFTATPLIGCSAPLTVTFTDASSGPDTWIWRFGDGVEDTIQNTTPHTYTSPGIYTVTLVVSNTSTGCTDSTTQTVSISDQILGFNQTNTTGCIDLNVGFTDTSWVNSSITSWYWDFGDGGTSTNQNPSHTYTIAGIYDVTLIITDALGCVDTLTKTNWIDAIENPVADFIADTTYGCAPLQVNFTDLSTGVNPILSWSWNFGDGGTDTLQNPAYTYIGRGVFNVTLIVTDNFGCADTLTNGNYIRPTKPYTDFTYTPVLCNNDSLQFTNTSTGSGMTYVWDFGDGTFTSTGFSPYHTYNLNTDTTTVLPVMLTVTDSNGCDSTLVQNVTISIPVALFGADSLNGHCPPHLVNFTDSSSLDVTNWSWNFGDNTTASNMQNPTHTYTQVGSYNVSLTVENNFGCFDTLLLDTFIVVNGPLGTFTFNILPGTCFKGVAFESSTTNTDSIFFIFGDGGGASGDTVVHQYLFAGTYNTLMAIFDSSGCQVNVPGTPLVIPQEVINANYEIEMNSCSFAPYIFTDLSTSNTPLYSWLWDFGDGTTVLALNNDDVMHNYSSSGSSITYLTVTDTNGCEDTASFAIEIPEELDAPNVFSPNNDGINDIFQIVACGMEEYDIEIFNRWGMLIFKSAATRISWNGYTTAGSLAPPGTYFYIINATSESGVEFINKGSLTLLR